MPIVSSENSSFFMTKLFVLVSFTIFTQSSSSSFNVVSDSLSSSCPKNLPLLQSSGNWPTNMFYPSAYAISTHTPHARRDPLLWPPRPIWLISTHTPHARRDLLFHASPFIFLFLLTRLMRGVTTQTYTVTATNAFLLTRLMRGVTQFQVNTA